MQSGSSPQRTRPAEPSRNRSGRTGVVLVRVGACPRRPAAARGRARQKDAGRPRPFRRQAKPEKCVVRLVGGNRVRKREEPSVGIPELPAPIPGGIYSMVVYFQRRALTCVSNGRMVIVTIGLTFADRIGAARVNEQQALVIAV